MHFLSSLYMSSSFTALTKFGQDKASQVTCSEALLCLDGCSLLFRLCHLQGIHHILVMFWSLKRSHCMIHANIIKHYFVSFCDSIFMHVMNISRDLTPKICLT